MNKKQNYALSYEKKVFSQHGEDGIIEVMTDAIKLPNKMFLEIGFGNGSENMGKYLLSKGWKGLGIDAVDPIKFPKSEWPDGFKLLTEFVYPDNCSKYLDTVPHNCDFFSLDIDSFDYEIIKRLFDFGFRPKTVCVEINKFFGPNVVGSFPYRERTKRWIYHKLYYSGVSLEKYRKFFKYFGYNYFGVDSSFTNAFFYKPEDLNDISSYEIIRDDKFPVKTNQMKENIKGTFWEKQFQDIFKQDAYTK
jgi:hypothetical protein